ncbi:MAG: substrate-binding domain-containing protein [Treponema sp.]|nr:substrate-binding domain-containing protein [Candidatus Treponema equifaecale]
MKKIHNGRRVGFILGTIHSGTALKLWHKLAIKAQKQEGAFFVFPGGKLDNQNEDGRLRNKIYSLVNSHNVDGLISWASSITGAVSSSELEIFHNRFDKIPYVTIGQKINGRPCVEFDAYAGMKELVKHFINCHSAKKIAFIRGPESHTSAADRYRGYKDALKESGIELDEERLVSSNFGWYEGDRAIIQLCEERGLVPGKDFDAIITSSDLMGFEVQKYLKQRGIRIPKDVMVGGFNDTSESKISVPSFSTVHMPHSELGYNAYDMVFQLLNGEKNVQDRTLPAYPVIRESCGCNTMRSWSSSDVRPKIRSRKQFVEEVCKIFRYTTEKTEKILGSAIDALFEADRAKFIENLNSALEKYFEKGGELLNVFAGISLIKNTSVLPDDFVEKVVRYINVMVPRCQERVNFTTKYSADKTVSEIGALKSHLYSAHSRKELIQVLKPHLEKIGMNTVSVVLRDDSDYSVYVGGYNSMGEVHTDELKFPCELLIPEKFDSEYDKGSFVVQPLFVDGREYGHIIVNYVECDGSIYEDIRTSVSNAIQNILLFEEINEAKKVAETAEFEKTEFFANVGSELVDPLKDLSAKISQMETNVINGVLDQDILSEQLLFLRSQIDAQIDKTETLVDLTRSQVDDLPMDKKLFDIRQVLPGSAAAGLTRSIPLLYGDSERLKKALEIIFSFAEKTPYIAEKTDGLHIEFYALKFDWQKPELLLAENILLLQYAILEKSENFAEIVLPWPNLSGLPPENHGSENTEILSLSEKIIQSEIYGINVAAISSEAVAESASALENALLYWEPDDAPIDEWVKVYGMRKNDSVFRSPILCFSRNLIGHNFVEMLEQKIKSQRVAPVLFVNAVHTHYGTWATDSNTVSIASMDDFDKILEEITPSLIVFESITEQDIKKIRQNHKTVLVPILVLPDSIETEEEVELLCSHPRIILCNRGAAESEQFDERIKSILNGDEILPPHTGALVKKAILYLNKNASQQIVRWKLADTVHVSEDYLTRIFHKEIGLSLWEYLNRYRIYLATKMLLETNDTIYEIAENSGFQDQAYFCRVFKKIYGVPPGKIRSK